MHEVKTKCGDYFRAGDLGNFDTSQSGLARDKKQIRFGIAARGKTFLHHRCKGETVFATWDEAMAYAESFLKRLEPRGVFLQRRNEINYGI